MRKTTYKVRGKEEEEEEEEEEEDCDYEGEIGGSKGK